ncbi:MAG: hypothetical protein AB2A00_24410 [Myxococcota bacterium]
MSKRSDKAGEPKVRPAAAPKPQDASRGVGRIKAATHASLAALDALEVDSLVLVLPEDERPLLGAAGLLDWRMCGWLSRTVLAGTVKGLRSERVLTHASGRVPVQRVFVFGGGPKQEMARNLPALIPEIARVVADAGSEKVALSSGCAPQVTLEALEGAPRELLDRLHVVFDEG